MNIKKSDWVTCVGFPPTYGTVRRVAKDCTWADVKWSNGNKKRMNTKALEVHSTISILGVDITDIMRENELK